MIIRHPFQAWVTVGLFFYSLSHAQLTTMDQTPELKRLEVFVGTWQRHAEPPPSGRPSPTEAQLVAAWGPGDVWMTWDAEIQFNTGQTIFGRRQIAWNKDENRYDSCWIDTQSAHIIKATARWVNANIFEVIGEPIPWNDGRKYRFRTQYKIVSPTEIHETGWRSVDGEPYHQHNQAKWIKDSK